MFNRPRRRLVLVLAATVVTALAVSGVALASGFSKPILKQPGSSVRTGKITFVVKDPGLHGLARPVYIQISSQRKLDKNGFLARCIEVRHGCYYAALKPWKGHLGLWRVTISGSFNGFFTSTPGKYYWQAGGSAPSPRSTDRRAWSARS
jgi:hypothetical protein